MIIVNMHQQKRIHLTERGLNMTDNSKTNFTSEEDIASLKAGIENVDFYLHRILHYGELMSNEFKAMYSLINKYE